MESEVVGFVVVERGSGREVRPGLRYEGPAYRLPHWDDDAIFSTHRAVFEEISAIGDGPDGLLTVEEASAVAQIETGRLGPGSVEVLYVSGSDETPEQAAEFLGWDVAQAFGTFESAIFPDHPWWGAAPAALNSAGLFATQVEAAAHLERVRTGSPPDDPHQLRVLAVWRIWSG